ncbi:unnamed protein product [Moneuplotes crassus]|uniref:Aminopeptidase n=1 Tax=Euplotes crassus TaxID=5936 RepID=A0AAD1XIA6_EUPCR|nr:unnamed protein product [Moneuplotes crassus]
MGNEEYKKWAAAGIAGLIIAYSLYRLASRGSKPPVENQEPEEERIDDNEEDIIHVDPQKEENIELSKKDALFRAEAVSDCKYDLVLSFLKNDKTYEGYNRISFTFKGDGKQELFLNYKGDSIYYIKINGKKISAKENIFRENKVYLPTKYLQEHNIVDIRFKGIYRKDGNGLHYYEDPDDNEIYLYTQFETFHASKCFPCFDQPDIKATMKLRSFSPGDWKVVTNEFENETTNSADIYNRFLADIGCPEDVYTRFEEDDNMLFRQFNTTLKISSYLYAFVVGPYVYEKNNHPNAKNYVPMRVMARKSVMKYVKCDDFFRITMSGMDYYEKFFGVKYPFNKYDQIFCPEFNAGAMENVGCVTYTESYLFRGEVVPQSDKEQLAITILHELAHMWFGNLVTMKWWDDLWLNESFATFMSHMAMAYGENLDDYTLSWEIFLFDKSWGLKTDEFSTTHPIAASCDTTEDADNIFDGISYGKGAAFLKQLVAFLSEGVFSAGLKTYFSKYAFQNTELKDFIGELQKSSDSAGQGIDVVSWAGSWISTSGFNVIEPVLNLSADGSIVDSFTIKQTLSDHGENCLREQQIKVALFNSDFGIEEIINVRIKASDFTLVTELEGRQAPHAILLNYEDWGYGRFLIDDRSMNAFQEGVSKIESSLSRKLIHNTFFAMTRDGQISAHDFANLIKKQIPQETNQDIVLEQLRYNLRVIFKNYIPGEYEVKEASEMFDFLLKEFLPATDNEQIQQIIVEGCISISRSEEHFRILKSWLETGQISAEINGEHRVFEEIKLSPEDKHFILKKISTSVETPKDEVVKFYEKHLENDENKDLARKCKLSCEAAINDRDSKVKHWKLITSSKSGLGAQDQQAIMSTLMPKNQYEIVKDLIGEFFKIVPKQFKTREKDDRDLFFFFLSPNKFATEELLEKYKALLTHKDATKSLINKTKDDIERIEKALKGQKTYLEGLEKMGDLKANI